MYVHYTGDSDVRIISKADWSGIDAVRGGPFDHDRVEWGMNTSLIQELNDDAADWLIANDPEFKQATEKQVQQLEEDKALREVVLNEDAED